MTAILLLPFVLALALMGRLWRWPRIWLLPFLLIPAFFLRGIVGELSVTSVVLLGWLVAGKPLLIPGWLRSVWLLLGGALYLGFFGLLPWDGYAMGFGCAGKRQGGGGVGGFDQDGGEAGGGSGDFANGAADAA